MNPTTQKVAIGLGVVAVGAAVAGYLYRRQPAAPKKRAPKKGKESKPAESINSEEEEDVAKKAQKMKDAGNDAFRAHNYEQSITYYTEGIKLGVDTHLLYSNRSAAYAALGKYKEAMEDAHQCIEMNPEWSKGYFRLGKALLATGDFDKAYKNLYKGLKLDASSAELKNLLAQARNELGLGDLDTRSKIDSKMIKLYYKRLLQKFCTEDMATDEKTVKALIKNAIKEKSTATLLEQEPLKSAAAANELSTLRVVAQLLIDQGQAAEALPYSEKALALDPKNPEVIQLHTSCLLRIPTSNTKEILDEIRAAHRANPNSVLVSHTLASVLIRITQLQFPLASSEIRAILAELQSALSNRETNQLLIADCGIRLWFKLFEDQQIQQMLMREEQENMMQQLNPTEAYLKGLTRGAFSQLCLEPFFMQSLSQIVFNNPGLERVLAPFRTAFASLSWSDGEEFQKNYEHLAPLMNAMALQCYRNNFAWANTKEDETDLTRLIDAATEILEKKSAESLVTDGILDREFAFYLVVIAMYMPLSEIDGLYDVVSRVDLSKLHPWLASVLKKSCLDAHREKELKEEVTFAAITSIPENSAVEFYNSHLNLTWDSAGVAAGRMVKIPMKQEFEWIFPNLAADSFQGKLRVLVAGCGSGSEIAQLLTIYEELDITGIDISASNLAYAIRQTRDLDLDAKFHLADVAQLDPAQFPDGLFDVVVAQGVLSHLSDPFVGLERLASVVRPGGLIRLSVFDRRYVDFVSLCRNFLNGKMTFSNPLFDRSGLKVVRTPTASEAREARNLLMDSGKQEIEEEIVQTPAFYSLNEFIDFVFHPQLASFTFSDIGELLERVGLNLISFEFPQISQETVLRYQVEFPDDPHMRNFASLDEFDARFPESFRNITNSIYFTCERPL